MGMHGNHKLEIEVDDEEERSDLEICSEEQLDLEDSSPQRAGDFDDFDDQSSEKKYDLETISPNI